MALKEITDLPLSLQVVGNDLLHLKRADGIDYKISYSDLMKIGYTGTYSSLTTANPTLKSAQWSYETDTGFIKIGDGLTPYNQLPYINNTRVVSDVKNTDFIAKLNNIYMVDTSVNPVNITLPSPVNTNSFIGIIDVGDNFDNTPAVLTYTSNNLEGLAEDFQLNVKQYEYKIRWSGDINKGWKIY